MSAPLRRGLAPALLVLATFLVYLPSLPGEFLWDDDDYVTENEVLRDPEGWIRVWIPRETPQYYPVVFSALWATYQQFGLDPLPYRLLNLALHALSALLVWRLAVCLRLPGPPWIAAAFALHPVHVESVAWVMELKNCLSGTLYLGAALAWLRFDQRRVGAYLLALLLFVLALLSKSVTCTLPAALVLVDWHRRRPLTVGRLAALAPFFALGISMALFTAHIESDHVRAQGAAFEFSLAERFLIATRALVFYLGKLVWPHPLLFNYPRWELDAGALVQWLPGAFVALVGVASLVLFARGRRGPFLALAFFAGTASPALGFVNYYPMLYSFVADHFVYLASVGVFVLAAAVGARLPQPARSALGVGTLAALALVCAGRAHDFRSAESLYRRNLEHHEDAWLARSTLGTLLLNRAVAGAGRLPREEVEADLEEALEHLKHATRLATAHRPLLRFGRALALYRLERYEEALEQVERVAGKPQGGIEALALKGSILLALDRPHEASVPIEQALAARPGDAFLLRGLGDVARARGEARAALEHYERALRNARDPLQRSRAVQRLARELVTSPLLELRDADRALSLLDESAALFAREPVELRVVRVEALAEAGRWDDAARTAEEVLELVEVTGSKTERARERARLEAVRRQERLRE